MGVTVTPVSQVQTGIPYPSRVMGSRVPRSGGKTLPVSLDVAGYSLPTRVTPTPSPALLLAPRVAGSDGYVAVFPYRGASTHRGLPASDARMATGVSRSQGE